MAALNRPVHSFMRVRPPLRAEVGIPPCQRLHQSAATLRAPPSHPGSAAAPSSPSGRTACPEGALWRPRNRPWSPPAPRAAPPARPVHARPEPPASPPPQKPAPRRQRPPLYAVEARPKAPASPPGTAGRAGTAGVHMSDEQVPPPSNRAARIWRKVGYIRCRNPLGRREVRYARCRNLWAGGWSGTPGEPSGRADGPVSLVPEPPGSAGGPVSLVLELPGSGGRVGRSRAGVLACGGKTCTSVVGTLVGAWWGRRVQVGEGALGLGGRGWRVRGEVLGVRVGGRQAVDVVGAGVSGGVEGIPDRPEPDQPPFGLPALVRLLQLLLRPGRRKLPRGLGVRGQAVQEVGWADDEAFGGVLRDRSDGHEAGAALDGGVLDGDPGGVRLRWWRVRRLPGQCGLDRRRQDSPGGCHRRCVRRRWRVSPNSTSTVLSRPRMRRATGPAFALIVDHRLRSLEDSADKPAQRSHRLRPGLLGPVRNVRERSFVHHSSQGEKLRRCPAEPGAVPTAREARTGAADRCLRPSVRVAALGDGAGCRQGLRDGCRDVEHGKDDMGTTRSRSTTRMRRLRRIA